MNDSPHKADRLDELIHMYCDGRLDEGSHRELEQLLSQSDSAANRFVELVQVWNELLEWSDFEETSDETAAAQKAVLRPARRNSPRLWTGLACVAALMLLAFSLGAYWGGATSTVLATARVAPTPIPRQENPSTSAGRYTQNQYAARVVEMSPNATWGEFKPREFLLRLAEGEQLDLQAGLARLEFASGASVILEGPASFEILTGDAGRLINGRMTGRAEDGNFKVLTRNAEVIDLGTEFGVSVDEASNTDVCVFDGEVNVSLTGGVVQARAPVLLTEGMAIRVEPNGSVNDAVNVRRSVFQRHHTRAARSANDGRHVSLVDIVAGGDGRRDRIAGAIDPRTGAWDTEVVLEPEAYRNRYSDGAYSPSTASPLIAGVFIPPAQGGVAKLDPAGATFDFGKNDGVTWGPIWSRRHAPSLRSSTVRVSDFWGTQTQEGILEVVEESRHGVVGLHASVGMTIDLRAVRMLEDRPVNHFHTEIANLDNSASRPPEHAVDYTPSVDFRVFLDGQLQFERCSFGRDGGRVAVDVPLGPNDRFLTLVSTDSGDSYSFDHLVLIDPELVIEPPPQP